MSKIKPFGQNILIKPQESKGILRAEEGTLCEYGEVLAIGSGVKGIAVGEVLAFTKWGVNRIDIDDDKHYLVRCDDRFVLGQVDLSGDVASSDDLS